MYPGPTNSSYLSVTYSNIVGMSDLIGYALNSINQYHLDIIFPSASYELCLPVAHIKLHWLNYFLFDQICGLKHLVFIGTCFLFSNFKFRLETYLRLDCFIPFYLEFKSKGVFFSCIGCRRHEVSLDGQEVNCEHWDGQLTEQPFK